MTAFVQSVDRSACLFVVFVRSFIRSLVRSFAHVLLAHFSRRVDIGNVLAT